MTDLMFPETFPNILEKPATDGLERLNEMPFCSKFPEVNKYYARFIKSREMQRFWIDVSERLPLEPKDGSAAYTIDCTFMGFIFALDVWFQRPCISRKEFERKRKTLYNNLRKIESVCKEEKIFRDLLNAFFHDYLFKVSDRKDHFSCADFQEAVNLIHKKLGDGTDEKPRDLIAELFYGVLPAHLSVGEKAKKGSRDPMAAHFGSFFESLVFEVYGENKNALAVKMMQAVIYADEKDTRPDFDESVVRRRYRKGMTRRKTSASNLKHFEPSTKKKS